MSDPLAVSILSKLTSWYDFDGNLSDALGANNLTIGTSVAGYQPGLNGQELMANSIGAAALRTPFQLTVASTCCVGGWMDYVGAPTSTTVFSLGYDFNAHNEALYGNSDSVGNFYAGTWANPSENDQVSFQGRSFKKYPITVQVADQAPSSASSNQVISINTGSIQNGRYFVVAQWVQGQIRLYFDGVLRGTVQAAIPRTANVSYFQVGNQFNGSHTPCGLEAVFFCQFNALTDQEVDWLYNADLGRSYAQIVALAS